MVTQLRPVMLRRLKTEVEHSLPKKEETIIDVEMTPLQKKYYRAILERNRAFLSKGSAPANIPHLVNVAMELRKCTNHPFLVAGVVEREVGVGPPPLDRVVAASGKMVLLDKLLPKLKEEGHRVLIFSQMTRMLDVLEDYVQYKGYKYERLDGSQRGLKRQEAMDRFCAPDSDRFLFLLSTRAGGLGLNLAAADFVIIFDSDWNPQNDIQAQARCHRIGQTRVRGRHHRVRERRNGADSERTGSAGVPTDHRPHVRGRDV
jgi:SNF2 family DNA or RNA helicase